MEKIRILFTIPNFLTAGSGREMFNIIERLDKQIFDPYIAVREAGGKLYDEILQKNYPVIVTDFTIDERKGLLGKIAGAKKLSAFFSRYKFHIWQSFNWSSDFTEALIARWAGSRYVYVKKNMNWGRRAWKIKSYLSKAIIARNTTLVDGYFSNRFFAGKTFYVPGGVNVPASKTAVAGFRATLGMPGNAILVSCVAQLVRIKDQATLIKAAASMNDCYVILAGAERDVLYAQELKELIAREKVGHRVFLIGAIDNVQELLNDSNVFVLPTTNVDGHEEGCPVALLEAMAAEVPCIASNVAGSRDLIEHEKCGLLFDPGDVNDLVQCIGRYIDNPELAKEYAVKAKQKVMDRYTLSIEAAAFAGIYKKLARLA